MKIFKHYPDKTKKPSVRTFLIGAAYDFGLVWIIQMGALFYFLNTPADPVIGDANRNVRFLIIFISAIQYLLIELIIWLGIYHFQKKRI